MEIVMSEQSSDNSSGESPPTQPNGKCALLNTWVDCTVMGGLAVVVWAAFALGGWVVSPRVAALHPRAETMGLLLLLFWYPHIVASWLSLYASRERMTRYPVTAFMAPALIVLGVVSAMGQPTGLLIHWSKLAMLWLGFHISSQTLGLCLMYARRAGTTVALVPRCLLGAFVYMSFLYPCLHADCGVEWTGSMTMEVMLPPMGLPGWLEGIALIALGISLVGPIGFTLFYRAKAGVFPPILVLAPAVAQFLWLVPGPFDYGTRLMCFAVFHGLQYLFLAGHVYVKERAIHSVDSSIPRFLWGEGFRYALLILVMGVLLFKGVPWVVTKFGVPSHMAAPAVVAGLVIHHAFVDGVLWKPRSPDAVGILFGSRGERADSP